MKFSATLLVGALLLPPLHAETAASPAGHDLFYAGEAKTQDMYLLRNQRIVWSYHNPEGRGEISDAVRLSNGHVLFAHQFGVTLIDEQKKVLWKLDAPAGCEIHTAQPIGKQRVVLVQNGNEPKCQVIHLPSGKVEREFPLPVGNPRGVHGQFRHARLTAAGTLLVAHMDQGKVSEYDEHGKELWTVASPQPWSAVRLANGNTLITSMKRIREVDPQGKSVWECGPEDLPDHKIHGFQIASRLPNGNTLVNNWVNEWEGPIDAATAPAQALEISPQKKVVWSLRQWEPPTALGPATTLQLLDAPGAAEDVHFGEFR